MNDILRQLSSIISQRKTQAPEDSYVSSLHHKGLNKILEKIGEESTETILAAKDIQQSGETHHLISESADLLFHMMVMLDHCNCSIDDVIAELGKRLGVSGLVEKAQRQQ